MIEFYYFHPASSLAAHIALEESGLTFAPRRARRDDAEERARLLRANPGGAVPTLVVDGETLTESVAILDYIAGAAPAACLRPEPPLARAQCLSLLAWFASTAHPSFRCATRPHRITPEISAHAAIMQAGRAAFEANLAAIDGMLEGRQWLMGSQFTVADGYIMVLVHWARLGGFPLARFANILRCQERMLARPAVRRALVREGSALVA